MKLDYLVATLESEKICEIVRDYYASDFLDLLPDSDDSFLVDCDITEEIIEGKENRKFMQIIAELDGGTEDSIITEAHGEITTAEVTKAIAAFYKSKGFNITLEDFDLTDRTTYEVYLEEIVA